MRSVAKHSYIRAGKDGKGRAAAHIRYIQFRKGEDRDQEKGGARVFFNADRDRVTGFEIRKHIAEQTERGVVMHKIILSPGINGVNMEDYTRELMEELGRSKGLELEYFATVHRNTDHDHAHVVIMGQDRNGHNVFLNSKHDYKLLRELGDRYLERYHFYERYLDQEIPKLLKGGYVPDKGDRAFELMMADLKSGQSLKELDKQRREQQTKHEEERPKFDKEHALANLPEEEKIYADGRVYTKHDRLEVLEDYVQRLDDHEADWLAFEQYKMLRSWIGTKRVAGDDYYERTGEHERLQQQFEEEYQRSLLSDNSPRKSYRQFIFESRGRLLESHEQYEIMMSRDAMKKELQELDDSGEADPVRRQQIQDQLEWLDELSKERHEDAKALEKEGVKLSPEKAKDKERSEVEEPTPKTDVRVSEEKSKDGAEKESPEDRSEDTRSRDLQDRQDQETRDRDDQDRRDLEAREEQDRHDLEAKNERDERDRLDQDNRDREERDRHDLEAKNERDERDRHDLEAKNERDERDRLDQENRDRDEQDRRDQEDRDEAQRRAQREAKEEAERIFKLQQELAKLRAQELEQRQPAKEGFSSKFQDKIDQYEKEIAEAQRRHNEGERGDDKSEPGVLDLAQPQLDLDKGIENNWQLEEKAGPAEHDIEDLLSGLDKFDEQDHPDLQGDINSILFGDNPEHGLAAYEKTAEERRVDSWEQNAFNPELIQQQQDRPDQELEKALGDEAPHTGEDVAQQMTVQQQEQQMQQQIAQSVQLQIQQTVFEPQKYVEKEGQEHEERDDGGEHGR